MAIKRNAMKCLKCGDIIESKSVHDFVRCSCDSIFVDGGHQYLRRGFSQGISSDDYLDLSMDENGLYYKPLPNDKRRKKLLKEAGIDERDMV